MQQLTLFSESTPVLPITYYPDFLTPEQANELYQHCLKLEWQQNQIRMLGKTLPVPRLECIYGDYGCDYLYSNSVFLKPLTWTDNLANLRDRITALTGYKFRIVIGNQYRIQFKIQNSKFKIKEPNLNFAFCILNSRRVVGTLTMNHRWDMSQRSHQSAWGHVANSKSNRKMANPLTSGWNTGACL